MLLCTFTLCPHHVVASHLCIVTFAASGWLNVAYHPNMASWVSFRTASYIWQVESHPPPIFGRLKVTHLLYLAG